MENKLLSVLLILCAGLLSISAFAAGSVDFNEAISNAQQSQKEVSSQINMKRPANRIDRRGLITKGQKMKRQVLDGTGGSVASQSSERFFKDTKAIHRDDRKDQQRLATELER